MRTFVFVASKRGRQWGITEGVEGTDFRFGVGYCSRLRLGGHLIVHR